MSLTNLKVGDKIRCRRGVDGQPPEVLDVLQVENGRALLCKENGVKAYTQPQTIETLEAYDYEIVVDKKTGEA